MAADGATGPVALASQYQIQGARGRGRSQSAAPIMMGGDTRADRAMTASPGHAPTKDAGADDATPSYPWLVAHPHLRRLFTGDGDGGGALREVRQTTYIFYIFFV